VLKACAEYDRLGQQRFLDTYGFGEATQYLLRVGERLYDSTAIVGVAYGHEHPDEGVLDGS
jgi:5-methylcytosine-specific restriction protein A